MFYLSILSLRRDFVFATSKADPIDLVGALTPENLQEEFEKWKASKGKSYNPQFVYDEKLIRLTLKRSIKLISALCKVAREYMKIDDWRAELTVELLVEQVETLAATIEILEAIAKKKWDKLETLKPSVDSLFGKATPRELDLTLKVLETSGKVAVEECLIGDDEQDKFSKEKLQGVIQGFLKNFDGILTAEECKELTMKRVNSEQIAGVIQKVVRYMSDFSGTEEMRIELYMSEVADRFGIRPLTADNLAFAIVAPTEELFADQLLQTVAHELNTHLRVMISTGELQKAVSGHFRPSLVSRTKRMLAQEGFAMLNGEPVVGEVFCSVFEPMLLMSALYAQQGHNFAETAKFIYETYNIDPELPDMAIHRDIWTIMQLFYGIEDTSVAHGYVLPWQQAYFLGPLRVLRKMARVDGEQFEEPLSLMRYSELSLEFMPLINRIEKQLGRKLARDPFEVWDFAYLNPEVPTPTEYCKHLLLDL